MTRLTELIAAHRAAVVADEANYTAKGFAINAFDAEESGRAEAEALRAAIEGQCQDAADVQAKVAYFLEPAIGNRPANIAPLTGEDGEGWDIQSGPEALLIFLRSLISGGAS